MTRQKMEHANFAATKLHVHVQCALENGRVDETLHLTNFRMKSGNVGVYFWDGDG